MHPQKRVRNAAHDVLCVTADFLQALLENYPYTDIVTWGHSDERFIVVVGNIVQQRKLIFKTKRVGVRPCAHPRWLTAGMQGKTMNNLIHDYVKFKVRMQPTS